jgi:hypothetical protein
MFDSFMGSTSRSSSGSEVVLFSQVFYDSFDENWDGRWVVSQSSDYGGNTVNLAST